MNCDAVEGIPAQTADSAIIVRLAPKVEAAQGFGRKLRDWARRKQGDRHPFTAGVLTSNSRDAFQQDVSVGSERSVVEHYLRSFEVSKRKRVGEHSELGGGKPGESLEPGQPVEITVWRVSSFIQNRTSESMRGWYSAGTDRSIEMLYREHYRVCANDFPRAIAVRKEPRPR